MRLFCVIFIVVYFSGCDLLSKRQKPFTQIKDSELEQQMNPNNQSVSVIETLPLMKNATRNLLQQARQHYQSNAFDQAIVALERAYEIQPESPQVSQFMAEIYVHEGNFEQAHYWASIATKSGPAKGQVCEKSWRILALVAQQLGYFAQQAKALEHKEECIVKTPERY